MNTADRFRLVPRPLGRDLSREQLKEFACAVAERPELWIDLVHHGGSERHYEELVFDEHLTVWLICWTHDNDTGFHDHDLSAGAVAVVGGQVREERLSLDGETRERVFTAGEAFSFASSDIHRVLHHGADPAVTLHVYSPPLRRMGAYYLDEDGLLARRAMSPEEELRPLSMARAA
jgi:predicted metal-dependent enzyme (double-stranded beta helix superfamily)